MGLDGSSLSDSWRRRIRCVDDPASLPVKESDMSGLGTKGHQHPSILERRKALLRTVQVLYLVLILVWIIRKGLYPGPEFLSLIIIGLLIWTVQGRTILNDFAPFLLVLFLYFDVLRVFVEQINVASVHITDLIAAERFLFGGSIPAHVLQLHWTNQPYTVWLDLLLNIVYLSHFANPLIAALVIWVCRKSHYWPFVIGFIVLSFAGFFTYVVFPAAPPWWATHFGYLPDQPVHLDHSFISEASLLAHAYNPVAAMPSLHAAYPFYIALYAVYIWGKRAWWIFLLPLSIALASVYLGHHYVVDILAGCLYATSAFGLIFFWRTVRGKAAPRDPKPA
jgi:membrane-associated phospholipid phosphatase